MAETGDAVVEVFSHTFEMWEPTSPTKVADALRSFGVDLGQVKADVPPDGLVFHTSRGRFRVRPPARPA